jgi:hypothetical protein
MNSRKMTSCPKICLYGAAKKIDNTEAAIMQAIPDIASLSEGEARLKLQKLIDDGKVEADILYDGNGVYGKKAILRDMKKLLKDGMESMTDRLYEFFHLCCGSISHYNKWGWIETYPRIHDLRRFFLQNEYGQRVLRHIPRWKTDVIEIVQDIEKLLGIEGR